MELFLPNIIDRILAGAPLDPLFAAAGKDTMFVVLSILLLALLGACYRSLVSNLTGYSSSLIINYLTVPGVFIHEGSHAIAAILTGAKVTEFSVVPQGDSLGHVRYIPSRNPILASIQDCVAGVAPAIVGFFGLIFLFSWAIPHAPEVWIKVVLWYIAICMLCHSELSYADIPNMASIIIMVALTFVFFWFVTINPDYIMNLIGFHPYTSVIS